MNIKGIDSLTLEVADIARAKRFYHEVFDLPIISENTQQVTLRCGHQQLKLTLSKSTNKEKSINFSIATSTPLPDVLNHLANYYIPIIDTISNTDSTSKKNIIIIQDYDTNTIEIVAL